MQGYYSTRDRGAVCKECGHDLIVRQSAPRASDGRVYCSNSLCRYSQKARRLGGDAQTGP